MPRPVRNALTVAQVRCASNPGVLVHGNGLMLRIRRAGARSRIQRIVIHRNRHDVRRPRPRHPQRPRVPSSENQNGP